ncbi:MAG TPA: hypothetical protein VJ483_08485 [Holophagaceae bacterium]|nr:hypothetical protein [Holophagaceae bacterium]
MNARSLLLALGLLAPLGAMAPTVLAPVQTITSGSSWTLAAGSQLVFTPTSGNGRLQFTQLPDGNLRVTAMTETTLVVTPDPTGVASYRQWTLAAGTDITINLSGGALTWDSQRRSGVTTLTILQTPGFSTIAPSTTTMIIDPDPGTGIP